MGDKPTLEAQAQKVASSINLASKTLRDAISKSLPVAPNQLLTVTMPGTVINYNDYVWDTNLHAFTPLSVCVNEARLADSMLPFSTISLGNSGKSVSRSYIAALDFLIPAEASASGVIADASAVSGDDKLSGRKKVLKKRYEDAMRYLEEPGKSFAPSAVPSGANIVALPATKSRLTHYVEKQEAWSKALEGFAIAQDRQMKLLKDQYPQTKEGIEQQREEYLRWVQANARDYKASIQARYMDWVVHGFKFGVEFNFGVVDISSGMARVEASKEAHRNMVVIAEDGFTEYSTVRMTPSNWASHVRTKILNWATRHKGPTADEIKLEIRRLEGLVLSYEALKGAIETDAPTAAVAPADTADADVKAQFAAYYKGRITDAPPAADADGSTSKLGSATEKWRTNGIKTLQKAQKLDSNNKEAMGKEVDKKIATLNAEIQTLKSQLVDGVSTLPAIKGDGSSVNSEDLKKDPGLLEAPPTDTTADQPDPWTKISCKVSVSSSVTDTAQSSSDTSVAASIKAGMLKANASANFSSASIDAMAEMAKMDVEVSMDCMLVSIERPWLHGELFVDADLDVSKEFAISPGEDKLLEIASTGKSLPGEYQGFPAYPTAFVLGSNIELNFIGDCTSMQSSLQSSSFDANASVKYGPVNVSASHKSSKTHSKTRMESTATGMKISIQAPQIISWVQTLTPALPHIR